MDSKDIKEILENFENLPENLRAMFKNKNIGQKLISKEWKIVAGDATQQKVSGEIEIAQKYLKDQHRLTVSDTRLYPLIEHTANEPGKIWIPIVCSHDQYLVRLGNTPGISYNYAKDNKKTCAESFGFDRMTEQLHFVLLNDSMESDKDLRLSWDAKQKQKPDVRCVRITEYMAYFDYILHTREQQLDSGDTYTRTESLYSFDGSIAHGCSQYGGFGLGWDSRDYAFAYVGFRAVSAALII